MRKELFERFGGYTTETINVNNGKQWFQIKETDGHISVYDNNGDWLMPETLGFEMWPIVDFIVARIMGEDYIKAEYPLDYDIYKDYECDADLDYLIRKYHTEPAYAREAVNRMSVLLAP